MRIKYKSFLFLFILFLAFVSLSLPVEAALSSKYDSPAAADQGPAAVKPSVPVQPAAAAPAKPAPAAKPTPVAAVKTKPADQPTNDAGPLSGRATVIERKDLKAKQLELIKKEHAVYCKAFIDAEMGLRYFSIKHSMTQNTGAQKLRQPMN